MTSVSGQFNRRAVLLLEVVVALAVMVTAMGLLGAQLVGGLRMTAHAEELMRASQLADRVLALLELDPNMVERFVEQREIDGDFGEQYPGWFWRAWAEEVEEIEQTEEIVEEAPFSRVTIEILHQSDPERRDDIEDAQLVRQLHVLKAARGTVDLERDFGMPPEAAEMLKANLPPEVLTEDGEIDFARLVQFIGAEDLFALLPMVMALAQQGGGIGSLGEGFSVGEFSGLFEGGGISPDELSGLITGAGGGAGGNDAVRDLIMSQLGGQLSEEELNNLLRNVGRDGGGGGRGPAPATGGDRTGGSRRGRTIEDLANERDARNLGRAGR
ncbi:MAG: hypothetical protein ACE5I3_00320 [Phycisphaerae bacterium]